LDQISTGQVAYLDTTQLTTSGRSAASAVVDTLTGIENLIGSTGQDVLVGSSGANVISGGAEKDYIDGGAGADTLNGDAAADTITGGAGNDIINGGASALAADTMTGGTGTDTFAFTTKAEAIGGLVTGATTARLMDFVTDFNVTTDGDLFMFGTGTNAFAGTTLTFTGTTTVTVTAITHDGTDRATFGHLAAAVTALTAGGTGVASTNTAAQFYLITTGAIATASGFASRTFLVLNDETAAIGVADTWIDVTGVTGTIAAANIFFGAA
jgi:hypothetical protein